MGPERLGARILLDPLGSLSDRPRPSNDRTDEPVSTLAHAAGRADQIGPLAAARTYPRLIVAIVLVVFIATMALVMTRPEVYTAETRLLVGSLDAQSQAVPGYVLASQQLAATYARVASSGLVADD